MNIELDQALPGISAHLKMAPPHRIPTLGAAAPDSAVEAAVLALLSPPQTPESWGQGRDWGQGRRLSLDWQLLLIRRAVYEGVHSGQIALPGGKRQDEDKSPWETALRETREEVGIPIASDAGHCALTQCYILPSNALVHPFLACGDSMVPVCPDGVETTGFRWLPIAAFDPAKATRSDFFSGGTTVRQAPCWLLDGYVVWGATAMILCEIYELVASGALLAR